MGTLVPLSTEWLDSTHTAARRSENKHTRSKHQGKTVLEAEGTTLPSRNEQQHRRRSSALSPRHQPMDKLAVSLRQRAVGANGGQRTPELCGRHCHPRHPSRRPSSEPGLSFAGSNYPPAPRAPSWCCLASLPCWPRDGSRNMGSRKRATIIGLVAYVVALLTSWSGHSSCRGSRCSSAPGTTPARSTRWSWLLPLECVCRAAARRCCCGAR